MVFPARSSGPGKPTAIGANVPRNESPSGTTEVEKKSMVNNWRKFRPAITKERVVPITTRHGGARASGNARVARHAARRTTEFPFKSAEQAERVAKEFDYPVNKISHLHYGGSASARANRTSPDFQHQNILVIFQSQPRNCGMPNEVLKPRHLNFKWAPNEPTSFSRGTRIQNYRNERVILPTSRGEGNDTTRKPDRSVCSFFAGCKINTKELYVSGVTSNLVLNVRDCRVRGLGKG